MVQVLSPAETDNTSPLATESEAVTKSGVGQKLRHGVRRYRPVLLSLSLLVLVIGAWQLSGQFRWINPVYTSTPWAIVVAAYHFLPSAEGLNDLKVSGEEVGIGLALAIVVGVIFGLLMGWYRYLEEATGLVINIFYSIPLIALAPLLVMWFGIGIMSKIVIVFLSALFPILISTLLGVKNVDKVLLDVARSFNAGRLQIWRTVLLPASVPSVITGVRLGMVGALVGVVVGEFIAATAGIGFLITVAANNFNTTLMFVGVLVIAISAVILTTLLRAVERRFSSWRVE
jgi:NitT/TauT family transport system permease protein